MGIGVDPGFYLYQGARLAGFLVQPCRFITKLIVGYFLPFIDKFILCVFLHLSLEKQIAPGLIVQDENQAVLMAVSQR